MLVFGGVYKLASFDEKLHLIEVCYGSSLLMDKYYRSGRSTLVHNTEQIIMKNHIWGGGFLKYFFWNFHLLKIGEDERTPFLTSIFFKKGLEKNHQPHEEPPTTNHIYFHLHDLHDPVFSPS